MKELSEYHQTIIHMLAHAFSEEKLFAWVARDIKNREDVVILGLIHTDENGEDNTLPLAVLNNEEEDYYEKYDFDFYERPITHRRKPWWQFWR